MTHVDESHTCDLFRQARRDAAVARRWARRAADQRGNRPTDRPEFSERECVAASVIASAAVAEDWIIWAHLATRVPMPRDTHPSAGAVRSASSARLWSNIGAIARANGHDLDVADPWPLLFLSDLDTWYRFLRHDSMRARSELGLRLASLGVSSADTDFREVLVAPFATTAIAILGHIFSWAHQLTELDVPYALTGLSTNRPGAAFRHLDREFGNEFDD